MDCHSSESTRLRGYSCLREAVIAPEASIKDDDNVQNVDVGNSRESDTPTAIRPDQNPGVVPMAAVLKCRTPTSPCQVKDNARKHCLPTSQKCINEECQAGKLAEDMKG